MHSNDKVVYEKLSGSGSEIAETRFLKSHQMSAGL